MCSFDRTDTSGLPLERGRRWWWGEHRRGRGAAWASLRSTPNWPVGTVGGEHICISGQPPERGYYEPPDELYFADLVRTWAVGIARRLVGIGRQEGFRESSSAFFGLDECWVGEDCAVYVRYRHAGRSFGARFAELDVDMLSGHPIPHGWREESGGSSLMYAVDIRTALEEGPYPAETMWTDPLGYQWKGAEDTPPRGWRQAVEGQPRLETVLPLE